MEVKHRIVSIDRPYIKSLVRGKENKRVEFGAKVNNIQIDEISFIEHHYFEAFNEGVRLKESIIIGTLRSIVMEGSLGNQKQHYNVGRIAARNSRSETLLLFCGMQCANAAILAARQLAIEEKRKQRKRRWA